MSTLVLMMMCSFPTWTEAEAKLVRVVHVAEVFSSNPEQKGVYKMPAGIAATFCVGDGRQGGRVWDVRLSRAELGGEPLQLVDSLSYSHSDLEGCAGGGNFGLWFASAGKSEGRLEIVGELDWRQFDATVMLKLDPDKEIVHEELTKRSLAVFVEEDSREQDLATVTIVGDVGAVTKIEWVFFDFNDDKESRAHDVDYEISTSEITFPGYFLSSLKRGKRQLRIYTGKPRTKVPFRIMQKL